MLEIPPAERTRLQGMQSKVQSLVRVHYTAKYGGLLNGLIMLKRVIREKFGLFTFSRQRRASKDVSVGDKPSKPALQMQLCNLII